MEKGKAGRPTDEVKSRDLRVRVPERLYEALRKLAAERGQTLAGTIRDALEQFVK